ncbi:hypothetical protein ACFXGA_02615 [Actinosynnema sp. NPDC059335]|uniref:LppU/SCO3897 family protein n=1 Tax=Actinosynnema sp. NPDC059335 TaxID=3346804 RepID=UPI003672C278
MTTPPNQPTPGQPTPDGPQGFPPPQQPGWGSPSSPQGFPAPGQPYPGQPYPPGQYQPMPGYQGQPPQYAQPQYPQPQYPQPGQYGAPGQYAAPGQPGQPGYPQQFPPPAKGTSRGAKALVAVVALGIVGVVVAGIIANVTGPAGAEAGDCIKVISASVTDADVEKIDCSSGEAAFKVAANLDSSTDSCPDGDYAEYTDSGGRRSNGFKLCLMLNAAEGDCFKQEGSIVAAKTTKVACDSGATYKVGKVVTGRADENECESGDTVSVYSQPATTICLTEA